MPELERPPTPEPLPHPVADNHCHLDVTRGPGPRLTPPEDVDRAIAEAAAVNVTRIVQIGCDVEAAHWAVEAAHRRSELVAAVAIHPNDVPRLAARDELVAGLAEIEELAADPVVRAIGETGLDHFRTPEGPEWAMQAESFAWHIDMAKRLDKTLVIHDRDSHQDVLDVLDAEGLPNRWVMHCFSGDAAFAKECLDRGAYLSFAGTVTFGNAQHLRDALAITPQDRVLVETDAPFLTPHPHRGATNASYLIPLTMRLMAQVREEDLGELCAAVDRNTTDAFGGVW